MDNAVPRARRTAAIRNGQAAIPAANPANAVRIRYRRASKRTQTIAFATVIDQNNLGLYWLGLVSIIC